MFFKDKSKELKYCENDLKAAELKARLDGESAMLAQKERIFELKKQVDDLTAELDAYRERDDQVGKALIDAVDKAGQIESAAKARYKIELDQLRAFHNRWMNYYERILARYPLDADIAELNRFNSRMNRILSKGGAGADGDTDGADGGTYAGGASGADNAGACGISGADKNGKISAGATGGETAAERKTRLNRNLDEENLRMGKTAGANTAAINGLLSRPENEDKYERLLNRLAARIEERAAASVFAPTRTRAGGGGGGAAGAGEKAYKTEEKGGRANKTAEGETALAVSVADGAGAGTEAAGGAAAVAGGGMFADAESAKNAEAKLTAGADKAAAEKAEKADKADGGNGGISVSAFGAAMDESGAFDPVGRIKDYYGKRGNEAETADAENGTEADGFNIEDALNPTESLEEILEDLGFIIGDE